jgi:hypothetical protein
MKPSLPVIADIYVESCKVKDSATALRIGPTHHRPDYPKAHITTTVRLCFVTLLLTAPCSAQTAIVAARSPDIVIIGADSKGVRGGNKSDIVSVCKVQQIAGVGFFYAVAGPSVNPPTHYDIDEIIRTAFHNEETLTEKVNRFERLIETPLSMTLEYIRRDNPAFYRQTFEGGDRVALEIVFAGVENGTPTLILRAFTIAHSDPISVRPYRRSCPGDCPTGIHVFYLGQKQAMFKFAASHPRLWDGKAESVIEKLIQVAIADKPDEVGPPIDILGITKDGAQWVQRKKECPDIQPQAKADNPQPEKIAVTATTSSKNGMLAAIIAGTVALAFGFYILAKRR